MDLQKKQKDWGFLLVSLGLGLLAEISFFHGNIGLSYPVFITGLYIVFFLRYRFRFNHRRIGLLMMMAIWVLAATYVLYDTILFYNLNLILIPVLVFFHIVLVTSPNKWKWSRPGFAIILKSKLKQAAKYNAAFCDKVFKQLFKNMDEKTMRTAKRIGIGLVIGLPLLLVITVLLMSADAVFKDIVLRLPQFVLHLDLLEGVFRTALILFFTLLFFGIFQTLHVWPNSLDSDNKRKKWNVHWDSIIAITILILLNLVYVLFAVIQFKYFFNGGLLEGFTYAEYARRGFFELVIVTLINWSLLISFLKLVKVPGKSMNIMMKSMYSLLIGVSGVMLASAYQRLSMYEAAYGFTLDRVLAQAFMLFLLVIFAYTFIRVWIERLSLLHFYLVMGLIFYAGLNVMQPEQIVVDKNLERFEETRKIDVFYLNSLSYTGVAGLIDLYEKDPDYPELKRILFNWQQRIKGQTQKSWQSFNFTRQEAVQRLKELDFR